MCSIDENVTTPDLEAELVGLAGRLAAQHCRFLLLLAEFDRREAWAGPGLKTCAHWLSWRLGMDRRTAQDHLRVARALPGLPLITEAFSAGRVSYSKVRALTRVAVPESEPDLLNIALCGTAAHVERAVRALRAATTDPAEQAVRRDLTWRWDEDGSMVLRARLTPEDGAAFLAVLNQYTAPAPGRDTRPDWPKGAPWKQWRQEQNTLASEQAPGEALDRIGARRADGLVAMATAATTGNKGVHSEIVVQVNTADATAAIEKGPALARSTAERLCCSGHVTALITDRDNNPLWMGRRKRVVTNAQLRALMLRDHGCCRFPGCPTTRVEAHHIRHWLRGGKTDIDNLILLCRFHHGLIHDRGYQLRFAGGILDVKRPDGSPIPENPPPCGALDRYIEAHTHERLHYPDTLRPNWAGEELDVHHFLDGLLPRLEQSEAA